MDLPYQNSDKNHNTDNSHNNNTDKRLVVSFIIFSLTFFALAMIALFLVIYTSDATELFKKTNEFFHKSHQAIGENAEISLWLPFLRQIIL